MNRAVVFAWVVMASAASAGTVTDTFEEPVGGATPANGFTAFGVTFHFTDSSALYGNRIDMFPPLTDPVLDGPTGGILTLEFLQPVTSFSFDFLLGLVSSEIEGVSVALSGPAFSGSTPLTAWTGAPVGGWFGLGAFSYDGDPITEAALTFSSSANFFAIDNLVYDQVELQGSLPIHSPEPGTVTLIGTAILFAAFRLKQARRR